MNIFFLHLLPYLCAAYHVDKHVVKMILETTQLLCSAHHLHPADYTPPYKLTHKNHPCSVWVRKSLANYKWLVELGIELCKEYTWRYYKIHKCERYIKEMENYYPMIVDIGMTPPALAMPEEFKGDDAVESYRKYYKNGKKNLHSWTKRCIPMWIL